MENHDQTDYHIIYYYKKAIKERMEMNIGVDFAMSEEFSVWLAPEVVILIVASSAKHIIS